MDKCAEHRKDENNKMKKANRDNMLKNKKTPYIKPTDENAEKKGAGFLPKLFRALSYIFSPDRLYLYIIVSFILTITIESLSRRSFTASFVFLYDNPLAFTVNYMIITITLLFSLLFTKRIAVLTLISGVWLGLGITQFVLLSFRVTPFTAVDFTVLKSVFSIIGIYLSGMQIALILTAILLGIAVVVFLFIKSPKHRIKLPRVLVSFTSAVCILFLSAATGYSLHDLSNKFTNLSEAYQNYGFAYCFSMSIFDRGVDRPTDYSESSVDDILMRIEENAGSDEITQTGTTPNVIYVQLESFFDVNYLKGVTFSSDPLENFKELKSKYPHGLLSVPVVGAGTVNTEFEVLTGMSVHDFGTGEYPYKSILGKTTCESIAYILKNSGYTAHALHNNNGTFYSRNDVYKNLGFDTFTSVEYMSNTEYTETGWAKDSVLTSEIMGALNSTDSRDFVFAVSVQAHGKYPDEYTPEDGDPRVLSGIPADDIDTISAYNYYLKQLDEMDDFIKELCDSVLAFDEPTVLVFYGDHLPSMQISNDMLSEGNEYTTEYVVVSNYDDAADSFCAGNINSYMLSSRVLSFIGCDSGIINRLHIYMDGQEEHLEMLKELEYDMLYGERYSCEEYDEMYPVVTDMRMGYSEITVMSFEVLDDMLYVYGSGFTGYSAIVIDSSVKDGNTEFINEGTLRIHLGLFKDFESVSVAQVNVNGVVLSETSGLYNVPAQDE